MIFSYLFDSMKNKSHLTILNKNQRTNGPVNAHLISGPTVSTKSSKIGQGQPGSSFI